MLYIIAGRYNCEAEAKNPTLPTLSGFGTRPASSGGTSRPSVSRESSPKNSLDSQIYFRDATLKTQENKSSLKQTATLHAE